MSAYAAVISLKKTIERILDSSRYSFVPPSPEILRRACRPLKPLKRILERLDSSSKSKSRRKVNALDEEIKEALWRIEDLLEHHVSDQILSQSRVALSFSIDLRSLGRDVDCFVERVKDLEKKYVYELDNMPPVDDDDEWVPSRNDSDGMRPTMVELFSDLYEDTKRNLMSSDGYRQYLVSIWGMPGSGKTTIAKKLFDDQDISGCFQHRVWVEVGRKSQPDEIVRRVLAEVDPHMNEITRGDEEIRARLRERMMGKRCLIVLDDVWDGQVLQSLSNSLPGRNDALIRFFVTSTIYLHYRFETSSINSAWWMGMRALSAEESENLLREKVFGGGDFPPHLKEAAKKIAKHCRGLPLMIVNVANILSSNTDAIYWNDVAEKQNSVLRDAFDKTAKVLFPVYDCLPQHLKMLCLYAGAFPEDYEIPLSTLIDMLDAEGYGFEVRTWMRIGYSEYGFITEKGKAGEAMEFFESKTWRINPFWRRLFNIVASRNKFLRVLDSDFNSSEEDVKGQRRLCLHSNFVLNFKEVHHSVKRDCASNARSLLCFGPYHQYSSPLDVGFKLLRVLDALKVRFYIFPIEILNLVQLRYLALCYNGKLPTCISTLFNLQFLIVLPHVTIKSSGTTSYVPVQIWDMQELKHVNILGSNLPNPNSDATLQKLSTLLGVSPHSCTREVLEKIPNIKKLGIQIELNPQDEDCDRLSCFSHIFLPHGLDIFKCSITNPEVKHGFVAPLTPLSAIPQTLRKLHLSGFGYPWKYMKVIGWLSNLEVLKLRCSAFRGPKWGVKRNSFMRLKFLLIEDSDLVQWKPNRGSFPELRRLSLKHCYKLQKLHWPSNARYGASINLLDCGLSVVVKHSSKAKGRNVRVTFSSEDKELQQVYSKIQSSISDSEY